MHILIDIGGMLVHSVLKSNQIAQHVVSDVGNKSKQNGTAGRQKKKLRKKLFVILTRTINNVSKL